MPEYIGIILIGLAAGFVSGMVGVGGGIILVPAMVYLLGYSQHMAQGTSLAMMIPPIGILAVYNYYQKGHVDIKVALILAAGFFVGAFFGSKLAIKLPGDVVKRIFGIFLALAAVKMIIGK